MTGKSVRGVVFTALILAGVLVAASGTAHAQSSSSDSAPPVVNVLPRPNVVFRSRRLSRSQIRALNAERQKHIVTDTERLLALAQELKASVREGKDVALSPEIARKLDEIEKLARQVQKNERE